MEKTKREDAHRKMALSNERRLWIEAVWLTRKAALRCTPRDAKPLWIYLLATISLILGLWDNSPTAGTRVGHCVAVRDAGLYKSGDYCGRSFRVLYINGFYITEVSDGSV